MAKRKRGSEMAEMAEMERIFNGICKHHVNKRSDLSSSEAKVKCNDRPCFATAAARWHARSPPVSRTKPSPCIRSPRAQVIESRLSDMGASIFDKVRGVLGPAPNKRTATRLMEPVDQSLVQRLADLEGVLASVTERLEASRARVPAAHVGKVKAQLSAALEGTAPPAEPADQGSAAALTAHTWAECLQEARLKDLQRTFELVSSMMAKLMADLPGELAKWRQSVQAAEAVAGKPASSTDGVIEASLRPAGNRPSPKRHKAVSAAAASPARPQDVMRQRLLASLR